MIKKDYIKNYIFQILKNEYGYNENFITYSTRIDYIFSNIRECFSKYDFYNNLEKKYQIEINNLLRENFSVIEDVVVFIQNHSKYPEKGFIKEKVIEIIKNELNINDEYKIDLDSRIDNVFIDNNGDSLDKVTVILSLENEFNLFIHDEDSEKWNNIDDIVNFIYNEINETENVITSITAGTGIYISNNNIPTYIAPKAIVTTSANPFHYGHLDLYNKAKEIFPDVKVVIAQNSDKSKSMNLKEHMDCYDIPYEIIENETIADYCKENGITHIVRGIRNGVDAEYELKMDFVNKEINPDVQTVFIPTSDTYSNISSSTIRELLKYKKYDIVKKFMREDAMVKYIHHQHLDTETTIKEMTEKFKLNF